MGPARFHSVLVALSLLLIPLTVPPAHGEELFSVEVNEKNPRGKALIISIEELVRGDNYSILNIEFTSGASVPSSMFIAKAGHNIAKLRGFEFFTVLAETFDAQGHLMKVGFSNSKDINFIETYGKNIKPGLSGDSFLSVSAYSAIFGW